MNIKELIEKAYDLKEELRDMEQVYWDKLYDKGYSTNLKITADGVLIGFGTIMDSETIKKFGRILGLNFNKVIAENGALYVAYNNDKKSNKKEIKKIQYENELLEELARLEHEQWVEWSQSVNPDRNYLINIIKYNDTKIVLDEEDEEFFNSQIEKSKRWESLWVKYHELSFAMKDEDRKYAQKVLDLLEEYEVLE
jgi:hypothetical protein